MVALTHIRIHFLSRRLHQAEHLARTSPFQDEATKEYYADEVNALRDKLIHLSHLKGQLSS